MFIYEALLEYLLCGYTAVQTKSIVAYFTRMEQANLHTKRTFLEEHLNVSEGGGDDDDDDDDKDDNDDEEEEDYDDVDHDDNEFLMMMMIR